jgi:hypothetical protein
VSDGKPFARKIFETKGGSVFTGPAMIKLLANTARKAAVPAKHLCRMLAERSGVLQYIEYTTEGNKAQKQCASYILQTWQLDGQEAGAITQVVVVIGFRYRQDASAIARDCLSNNLIAWLQGVSSKTYVSEVKVQHQFMTQLDRHNANAFPTSGI